MPEAVVRWYSKFSFQAPNITSETSQLRELVSATLIPQDCLKILSWVNFLHQIWHCIRFHLPAALYLQLGSGVQWGWEHNPKGRYYIRIQFYIRAASEYQDADAKTVVLFLCLPCAAHSHCHWYHTSVEPLFPAQRRIVGNAQDWEVDQESRFWHQPAVASVKLWWSTP